jgi:hypothetical protein
MTKTKALQEMLDSYKKLEQEYIRECQINDENYRMYMFHRQRFEVMRKKHNQIVQKLKKYESNIIEIERTEDLVNS